MESIIVFVFITGYSLIALEHPIRINKTATALVTGVVCWSLLALALPPETFTGSSYLDFISAYKPSPDELGVANPKSIHLKFITESLSHHLGEIAAILFFLMGAMTIVELIDAHHGFRIITKQINTDKPIPLLWIISIITFFMSAVLDNLTTTIVMVSLIRKLTQPGNFRWLFAGVIIIAANAGGAWSPIGDVTTTMLWIDGKITTGGILKSTFLPSLACLLAPILYLSWSLRGKSTEIQREEKNGEDAGKGLLMLAAGITALILVPAFKTITHLPPYLGMLLALGLLWLLSEMVDPEKDEFEKHKRSVSYVLTKIDMPSVLFFMGILLAVGALETMSTLGGFAKWLDSTIGNQTVIITLIGFLSALVDNVPLVAASMGMYSMDIYPTDSALWTYLAYCAGTGGSILIIGSAAGVAAMGMEKIDFLWYLKRVSFIATLGYLAGAGVFLLQQAL
ncbi:MAG: sodium:proton antiporter NhaD [Bacteroidetes bacterium]|nr:sodium:proton antiporter NhaD [Bacteroidota bacterium]